MALVIARQKLAFEDKEGRHEVTPIEPVETAQEFPDRFLNHPHFKAAEKSGWVTVRHHHVPFAPVAEVDRNAYHVNVPVPPGEVKVGPNLLAPGGRGAEQGQGAESRGSEQDRVPLSQTAVTDSAPAPKVDDKRPVLDKPLTTGKQRRAQRKADKRTQRKAKEANEKADAATESQSADAGKIETAPYKNEADN